MKRDPVNPVREAVGTAEAVHDEAAGAKVDAGRRRVLSAAASAPVLTAAAGLAASAPAQALPLPLTPPDTTDFYDVGDSLVQLGAPTMPLVKLDIDGDGVYTMALPRLEQGTGIATAVAMMIAEEAGVPLSKVRVTSADAQPELLFNQITGGSCSVRAFVPVLPAMVAAARLRAGLLPQAGTPRDPAQFKVIGKRFGKLDALDIVTGRKKFTMDIDVPGAVPTMCRMPSTIRGSVASVNNRAAVLALPGVRAVEVVPGGGAVVGIPPGVAVMADTFGQAWDACNALDITWGPGTMAGESNATIWEKCRAAIPPQLPVPPGMIGIDAEFTWKAATACPLEVECAIVDATKPDRAEIWAGLQSPIVTAQSVALELGLLPTRVVAHVIPSGGAFGRRLFWDPVQVAAQVSKKTGLVCKLMYHRSDDIRHTRHRPPQVHKVRVAMLPPTLLTAGSVLSYQQSIGAVRLDARHGYGEIGTALGGSLPPAVINTVGNLGYEQFFFKTMVTSPYNFGVSTKLLFPVALEMNTVSYRSVHIQPARTVEEIIVDEIAAKLGRDPVQFRMEFLRLERAKAVLQRVAGAAQWGKRMPAGFAQGVGVHMESRSFSACIVELDARDPQNCKVTKVVMAIDVGRAINPSGVEQQCHGGIAEAISLILKTGMNIKDGLPQEGSYNQYVFCKMRDFPKDVQIIVMPDVGEPAAGMGEVAMSAPSGAIANAYARATGRKPRNFPLNAQPVYTPTPAGQLPAVPAFN
ncbi:MAG TPA: molybdopterin cofactor-binding domain-containing protein [Methylibium sp.]|uniref:xanthine dehydrogenase family protein molybdopterin-binding subunit n=1 Tax=Methylibium sp. TaxID=2067992 RepID=UPI002DB567D1|nr:molybdopterin cofactor-binding domain-containing protein [Methylibium sp.]HEU4459158.1 molybdopterin cofactor-binding domain-containing protein [Methylibium sp.]